jgi:hypothetical protein
MNGDCPGPEATGFLPGPGVFEFFPGLVVIRYLPAIVLTGCRLGPLPFKGTVA